MTQDCSPYGQKDGIKDAPRDMIAKYVAALEKQFELSEFHSAVKALFNCHGPLEDGGLCAFCKSPISGHFFEECVARTQDQIWHLYVKKK